MITTHVKAQNVRSGDIIKLTADMGVASLNHKSKSPYRRIINKLQYMERNHGVDRYHVYITVRDYGNGLTMLKIPQDSRIVIKRPKYNLGR